MYSRPAPGPLSGISGLVTLMSEGQAYTERNVSRTGALTGSSFVRSKRYWLCSG